MRRAFIFVGVLLLLGACRSQTNANFATPVPNEIAPHRDDNGAGSQADISDLHSSQLQVILVPSEVIVGANRFAVGLVDPTKGMIHDATVHFRYFDLSNVSLPQVESEADANRLQTPDGLQTIYAQERSFYRAGNWGVEVQARYPDSTTTVNRISFQVIAQSPTLKPGNQAPALATRTGADVGGNLRLLSSARLPNPAFYQINLARAITNGKPTVLLFATPAFCQSRLCGPSYDVVSAVHRKVGDAVNFVHVEVYTGLPNPAENNWEVDPAMTAFGLKTEPWAFVIDRAGMITYRVEGLFTEEEIGAHLKPLVGP